MVLPRMGVREANEFAGEIEFALKTGRNNRKGVLVESAYIGAFRDHDWGSSDVIVGADHLLDALLRCPDADAGGFFPKKAVKKARKALKRSSAGAKVWRPQAVWYRLWGSIYRVLTPVQSMRRSLFSLRRGTALTTSVVEGKDKRDAYLGWREAQRLGKLSRVRRMSIQLRGLVTGTFWGGGGIVEGGFKTIRNRFREKKNFSLRNVLVVFTHFTKQFLGFELRKVVWVGLILTHPIVGKFERFIEQRIIKESVPVFKLTDEAFTIINQAKKFAGSLKADTYDLYHLCRVLFGFYLVKEKDYAQKGLEEERELTRCFYALRLLLNSVPYPGYSNVFMSPKTVIKNYDQLYQTSLLGGRLADDVVWKSEIVKKETKGVFQGLSSWLLGGRGTVEAEPSRSRFNFGDPFAKGYMYLDYCIMYGSNMTIKALKGEGNPAFGRDVEMFRVLTLLGRRVKNNAMLLGEAGVGKTAVVEGLACAVVERRVPGSFVGRVFVELEVGAILSSTAYRGDLELKMVGLVFEGERYEELVYFADEFHAFAGAGGGRGGGVGGRGGGLDITNMLKPSLARGRMSMIGATTTYEFQAFVVHDEALERRFTPVTITEPDQAKTLEMLLGSRYLYERAHPGVSLPGHPLQFAVVFGDKYISKDRYFPDKAVDLVDDAASALEFSLEGRRGVYRYFAGQVSGFFWWKFSQYICGNLPLAFSYSRKQAFAQRTQSAIRRQKTTGKRNRLRSPYAILRRVHGGGNEYYMFRSWEFLFDKEDLEKKSKFWRRYYTGFSKFLVCRDRPGLLPKLRFRLTDQLNPVTSPRARRLDFEVSITKLAAQVYARTKTSIDEVPAKKKSGADGISAEIRTLDAKIRCRIVGQENAVRDVGLAIIRSRTGIRDFTRALAVLFFAGTTGTGKTEIGKVVGNFFFGSEEFVYRLDMSEFCDRLSVARLIGAPPGYIGMDRGGVLSNFIRKRPFSLIIFDEFEKAHQTVADILLGVFDAARLADGCGQMCDFRNAMLLSTSNAGVRDVAYVQDKIDRVQISRAKELREQYWREWDGDLTSLDDYDLASYYHLDLNNFLMAFGFRVGLSADPEYLNRAGRSGESTLTDIVHIAVQTALALSFRPEFVNRLDRLVYFETFSRGDMIMVSGVMFQLFRISLMKRYSAVVNCSFYLVREVAYDDADVSLGARPVRRAFSKFVEDPLAIVVLTEGCLPLLPYNVYMMSGFGVSLEFKVSKDNFKVMRELAVVLRLKGRADTSGKGGLVSFVQVVQERSLKVAARLKFPAYNESIPTSFGPVYESWRMPSSFYGDIVGVYLSTAPFPEWRRIVLQIVVGAQLRAAAFV